MKVINARNVEGVDLLNLQGYRLRLVGKSTRRASGGVYDRAPNCSGTNINRHIYDGMLISEYRECIRANFKKTDPQFSLTKHLKHDIKTGFIELRRED